MYRFVYTIIEGVDISYIGFCRGSRRLNTKRFFAGMGH